MSEVASVAALVNAEGNTDEDILRVMNPALSERDRSQYLDPATDSFDAETFIGGNPSTCRLET
jgi:hypothetical protein